ncbi:MAG: hypothetical protein QOE03_1826, partial [Micromonosporaceae bacterium]|nr:hypothetical protein [Micromonosporaceae bacterium]
RRVGVRNVVFPTLAGFTRTVVTGGRRTRVAIARELWTTAKKYAAPNIGVIDVSQLIPQGRNHVVTGVVHDYNSLVVAALCSRVGCRRFFEIGTYLGETTWTVAASNPEVEIYTLDLPSVNAFQDLMYEGTDPINFERWDRGTTFHGTPEENRIHQLFGDSATFDFSPYHGSIDVVYIDGSHSYTYVKNDTEAALKLLRAGGTIVWDDFMYPGVFTYLNDISTSLEGPLSFVNGTRMAVYSTASDLMIRPGRNLAPTEG